MSSSATGVGMPICFLGAILLILTQKSSQKFGDVLGIGKVHQSQFLLRIRAVYKIFHNLNFLIICLSAPCSQKVQQPLKDSIR